MAVLQIGVPRSGNYWLYRILHGVMDLGGIRHKSFVQNHPIYQDAQTWTLNFPNQANMDVFDLEPHKCTFRIDGVYYEPIRDIDDYIHQCSHVWTHSALCQRSLIVLPKFDKIVYIIRDPRDIIISLSQVIFTPHVQRNYSPPPEKSPDTFIQNHMVAELRAWVRHVGKYLEYRDRLNIHVVFYERLLQSFDSEISDLQEYLNIRLNTRELDHLREDVGFDKMHSQNPLHVRKGQSRQWAETLSEEQKQQTEQIAGRMLRILHYPVRESDDSGLPYLSPKTTDIQLKEALAPSRVPHARLKQAYKIMARDTSLKEKTIALFREWVQPRIHNAIHATYNALRHD